MRSSLLGAVAASALCAQARSVPCGVPRYVVDYAPVVRLYSGDPYRPADIGAQLLNTIPENNFTVVENVPKPLTLDNLDSLNARGGSSVCLTSKDDVSTQPSWLKGVTPDDSGSLGDAVATAVIVVDKGNCTVDAFYHYFYAFDCGGFILGNEVGDHVGDWEHNLIRFVNGNPQQIWYSQHSDGEAFYWDAVQKDGDRPLVFSANGTHANYARMGTYDRAAPDLDLPSGVLNDYADNGPRWDPVLNGYFFEYDISSSTFSAYDDSTPVGWLNFVGRWGDQQYPGSDPRQNDLLDLHLAYKYTTGPTGPRDKNLNRKNICPDSDQICSLRTRMNGAQ